MIASELREGEVDALVRALKDNNSSVQNTYIWDGLPESIDDICPGSWDALADMLGSMITLITSGNDKMAMIGLKGLPSIVQIAFMCGYKIGKFDGTSQLK